MKQAKSIICFLYYWELDKLKMMMQALVNFIWEDFIYPADNMAES